MLWIQVKSAILDSSDDLITKVQKVMRLGFVEEVADDLVERHQLGFKQPAYYDPMFNRYLDED